MVVYSVSLTTVTEYTIRKNKQKQEITKNNVEKGAYQEKYARKDKYAWQAPDRPKKKHAIKQNVKQKHARKKEGMAGT